MKGYRFSSSLPISPQSRTSQVCFTNAAQFLSPKMNRPCHTRIPPQSLTSTGLYELYIGLACFNGIKSMYEYTSLIS